MAVVEISGIRQFIGGSGDTKPTTGVPAGSIYWAHDAEAGSVEKWIYDGAAWGLIIAPEAAPEGE